MRFKQIFTETDRKLINLRKRVISKVEVTDDTELLNKIYTTLDGINLQSKLAKVLLSDGDAKKYLDKVVQIILDTPGTYEEKAAFHKGFPEGYVDIDMMLSGKRVYFEDFLHSSVPGAPNEFARRVFNNLKGMQVAAKGPGEFALAVLSPKIDIFGAGDLKIAGRNIEVKGEGGAIGATGGLQHNDNARIISKYLNVDPKKTLGITEFVKIARQELNVEGLEELGTELFSYIFDGKNVDVQPIVNALIDGSNVEQQYLIAAWHAYQGGDKNKFEGIMLINYTNEEVRYYEDPAEMVKELQASGVQLIAANKDWASKTIMPGATLRRKPIDFPQATADDTPDNMDDLAYDYAKWVVHRAKATQPGLVDSVYEYTAQLYASGYEDPKTINRMVLKQFPQLK